MGEGDKGGKKGKGLGKEQVYMTHGHGQQSGDWLWDQELGGAVDSNGDHWAIVIEQQWKNKNKKDPTSKIFSILFEVL